MKKKKAEWSAGPEGQEKIRKKSAKLSTFALHASVEKIRRIAQKGFS
jgi:hypothetical protein